MPRWVRSIRDDSGLNGENVPKILIVDDHDVVRQGVRSILQRSRPDWEISGEAASGEEAITAERYLHPDVIVMDITMPSMNGLEASRAIVRTGSTAQVLILTMHEYDQLSGDVQRAGARGYVQKSQAGRDLVRAIDVLLGGGTFFGNPVERRSDADEKQTPGVHEFRSVCWA